MAINKKDRQAIFDKYSGRCAYCGEELQKGWHVDELLPVVRSWRYVPDERGERQWCESKGDWLKEHYMEHPERLHIDNQMPACAPCNIIKSSQTLEGFRQTVSQFVISLNKYSTQYKFAKRYGMVQEKAIEPVVFYFEKASTPPQQKEPLSE